MKSGFSLLFFIFSSLYLHAQVANQSGTLSGKLRSEANDEVIDYAIVNLINNKNVADVKTFMTENDGQFLFEDVQFGTYQVKIGFVGFKTMIIKDVVIDKDNINQNFGILKLKQEVNSLEEVVVTHEKSLIEFNGDTITYNVDQSILSAGSTASDVLKNVPMVSVDIDGKPTIAGKMNTRIFLDGKPSDYTAATMTDLLNVLPADAIARIEVINNPDVQYAADGDGILNIVLKKGYKIGLNGAISLTGSTLGDYNANLYTAYRDETLSLSGSYGFKESFSNYDTDIFRTNSNSTGMITSFYNQLSNGENSGNGHNARGSMDWDLTKKQNLRVSLNLNATDDHGFSHLDDYRLNASNIETELRLQDINSDRNARNGIFNADYRYIINKKNESLTAGFVYYQNSQSQGRDLYRITQKPNGTSGIPTTQRNANDIGNRRMEFNVDYKKPVSKYSNISVGLQTTLNKNGNDQVVSDYDIQAMEFKVRPLLTNEFIYKEDILSAYGSYNIRTKSRWSLRLGVRTEYTSLDLVEAKHAGDNPKPYFNAFPNVSLNKVYKKRFNFGLSYSKRITRPRENMLNPLIDDTYQTSVSFGNPGLLPSFTDQYQFSIGAFGTKWSFTPRVSYAISNRIIERYRIASDSLTYGNLATNKNLTFNLYGNYRPTKAITMAGGVSLSQVAYESKSTLIRDSKGTSFRFNGSLTGQFPYQIAAEGQFNYANNANSQGYSKNSVTQGIGIRKTFMANKLLLRFMATDPFSNRKTNSFTRALPSNPLINSGNTFTQDVNRLSSTTNYNLTLSYRFTKVGRNTVSKQKADTNAD